MCVCLCVCVCVCACVHVHVHVCIAISYVKTSTSHSYKGCPDNHHGIIAQSLHVGFSSCNPEYTYWSFIDVVIETASPLGPIILI